MGTIRASAWAIGIPLLIAAAEPASQTVRAVGEAVVTAAPDQASLSVGVVTQAATADAASAQNARQAAAVLADLRRSLGEKADIRTEGFRLSPSYRYPQNGAPVVTGYTATNQMFVRTGDLSRLGALIDAAARSGANSIGNIQFSLKDETAVRRKALAQAAASARANAEVMAAALGLRVMRVRSVETGEGPQIVPVQRLEAMAAESRPGPPIESGTIEIRATVSVVLEVAQ